jgi:hypothetical protein
MSWAYTERKLPIDLRTLSRKKQGIAIRFRVVEEDVKIVKLHD